MLIKLDIQLYQISGNPIPCSYGPTPPETMVDVGDEITHVGLFRCLEGIRYIGL